jgi:DNA-directed RNA polymerase subunit M/transcription elongation factor TFIIS
VQSSEEHAVIEDAVRVRASGEASDWALSPWPFVASSLAFVLLLLGSLLLWRRLRRPSPNAIEVSVGPASVAPADAAAGNIASANIASANITSANVTSANVTSVRVGQAGFGARTRTSGPPHHTLACPVCHHEYDDPTITFCPRDGAQLHATDGDEPPTQALICPACRRGYAAGTRRVCDADGEELVPYSLFLEHARRVDDSAKRICPTCGSSYGAQVRFCGRDGEELVPVN